MGPEQTGDGAQPLASATHARVRVETADQLVTLSAHDALIEEAPARVVRRNGLLDERSSAQVEALSVLTDAGDDHSVALIGALAVADSNPIVREEAVGALAGIGDSASVQNLTWALEDPDDHVREAAIEALADIGGEASAVALRAALADRNPALREEAVDALGEIGGPTAIAILEIAKDDPHSVVREAAAEYLEERSPDRIRR